MNIGTCSICMGPVVKEAENIECQKCGAIAKYSYGPTIDMIDPNEIPLDEDDEPEEEVTNTTSVPSKEETSLERIMEQVRKIGIPKGMGYDDWKYWEDYPYYTRPNHPYELPYPHLTFPHLVDYSKLYN